VLSGADCGPITPSKASIKVTTKPATTARPTQSAISGNTRLFRAGADGEYTFLSSGICFLPHLPQNVAPSSNGCPQWIQYMMHTSCDLSFNCNIPEEVFQEICRSFEKHLLAFPEGM
jgi:hypothetical protein